MNKAIHALKIWMLEISSPLQERNKKEFFTLIFFIVKVYIKCPFRSPHSAGAPKNDLQLIEDLVEFKNLIL